MIVIYKYELTASGGPEVLVHMPKDAEILSTAFQGDQLYIWAIVDSSAHLVSRRFEVVMTGDKPPIPHGGFIGTAMTHNEAFVVHIYDLGEMR